MMRWHVCFVIEYLCRTRERHLAAAISFQIISIANDVGEVRQRGNDAALMQHAEQHGAENAPKEPRESEKTRGFGAEKEIGMKEAKRRQKWDEESGLLMSEERQKHQRK